MEAVMRGKVQWTRKLRLGLATAFLLFAGRILVVRFVDAIHKP